MIKMIEKLSQKVDKLAKQPKTGPLFPALKPSAHKVAENEMSQCYQKIKQWREVTILLELVSEVEDLSLYPMDNEEIEDFKEGGAVLRCETCFTLYCDAAKKLTPARAAKKLAVGCNSICTGKYIEPSLMAELMSGKSEKWRKLKRRIIQHMTCSADGETHFKALSMIGQDRQLRKQQCEAAETLVKCAFTAVKSKAAALHYENQVAYAFSVGAQVGGSGDSRKMFPDLVKCMLSVINKEIRNVMTTCLPSTGLPPHYYLTLDKATVNKRKNQAVIICPMVEGKRIPIAVAAPEVYSRNDVGGIVGGSAQDSGTQALDLIETKYGKDVQRFMVGK